MLTTFPTQLSQKEKAASGTQDKKGPTTSSLRQTIRI